MTNTPRPTAPYQSVESAEWSWRHQHRGAGGTEAAAPGSEQAPRSATGQLRGLGLGFLTCPVGTIEWTVPWFSL